MELLIVMLITGVIAAVLIPNLLRAQAAANNTATMGVLRNAITAAESRRTLSPALSYNTSVVCNDPLLLDYPALPRGIATCEILQTANGTVGYATSTSGVSYQWNGATMLGPDSSPPATPALPPPL